MSAGMSHGQEPVYGLPRTHGAPCSRLLARSYSLKDDAAEIAWELAQLPNWCPPMRKDSLLRQHEALMLRALAAHHLAHGNGVLGKHYAASARRLDAA